LHFFEIQYLPIKPQIKENGHTFEMYLKVVQNFPSVIQRVRNTSKHFQTEWREKKINPKSIEVYVKALIFKQDKLTIVFTNKRV
jgi:hypothetical protein